MNHDYSSHMLHGSMVLVYLPTKTGWVCWGNVGKYSSIMVCMWLWMHISVCTYIPLVSYMTKLLNMTIEIVSFPINSIVIFHCYINVYQGVSKFTRGVPNTPLYQMFILHRSLAGLPPSQFLKVDDYSPVQQYTDAFLAFVTFWEMFS